jgi:hypothetical protein
MLRCPLCAGLNHTTLRGELLRCRLCSLGFHRDSRELPPLDVYRVRDGIFRFLSWNSWLGKIMRRPAVDNRRPFYFSLPTVKMFATQQGKQATAVRSSLPVVPIFVPWAYGSTIQARIETPPEQIKSGLDSRLTLGIVAACDAWQEALSVCIDMADQVADITVVLDTTDVGLAAELECQLHNALGNRTGGTQERVMAHPLEADFAAQRNRIQQEARTEWILQLDCDERLTAGTKLALSGIIDDAEREGWYAVALSRRNLVDGVVSALYPDVQYRLLRRAVRFTRAVHEYPQLGPSQRSFFYLGAEIIHHLASERLERREALYEGIQGGAGRPHDTTLLRLPLEANIMLPA